MRKYCADPVFVVVDVRRDVEGLPTQAYVSVDTVVEGRETVRLNNGLDIEVSRRRRAVVAEALKNRI
jgi:hypothetical protein